MKKIEILSPFSGRVVPIEEVPDPVFAGQMLGDGLAVKPSVGVAVAPLAGKITVLHSAGHAFAIQAPDGDITVLVHIGIDTVHMKSNGFTCQVKLGDQVKAGQPVVKFDLKAIEAAGHSSVSPVILPDLPAGMRVEKTDASRVSRGGDVLLTVITP
jgi:glucose-specific phosphotransferase system IIA component